MRIASWSVAVLLISAAVSNAQSTPQSLPLQTTSGTGFTGAPYSGKETTVKEQTLSDGTKITQTFVQLIWRDAEGRTRREMIRHTYVGAEYRSVIITDPVGGMYLKWTAGNESARKVMHIWPLTPAQRVTTPSPSSSEEPQNVISTGPTPTPNLQREILLAQKINGVRAEGTRTTRTIPLDEESSNRVIQVTNELWVSPELKIIVRHNMDDPRSGRSTTDVSDVVRGDPDPTLFRPPEGYEVVDHRVQNAQ